MSRCSANHWRRLSCFLVVFVLTSGVIGCSGGNDSGPDLPPLSMQANDELRSAALELGRESEASAGKLSKEPIWKYLDVVARTATHFGGPQLVSDSSTQPKVTPRAVAGLELTVVDVAKSLTGRLAYPDTATQHKFEAFDARREEKRLDRLNRTDLEATFRDNVRILMLLSLLTDENLSRQLVPPGSPKATELMQKGFFSEAGQLMVPAPPVDDIDIGPWGTFSEIVTRGPTLFSSIRYEATLRGGFPE